MICAIILAAGLSTRMGTQKLLLAWENTTVIGKVVATLQTAGISDVRVVTGGAHAKLTELFDKDEVKLIHNPDYANGEMLTSLQVGLRDMPNECEAILVVLGDQPQIEAGVIEKILSRYRASRRAVIVPSYKMHRGHPWLLGRAHWAEVLQMRSPLTLRDFLNQHNDEIDYVEVGTASVIQDLDTQKDYDRYKPGKKEQVD